MALDAICARSSDQIEQMAAAIQETLVGQQWPQLATLLLQYGLLLLSHPQRAIVQEALGILPPAWRKAQPALYVLDALLKLENGEHTLAIQLYECAAQLYATLGNHAEQIHCFLESARLYHKLEDLEAARFYTDQASNLLGSLTAVDLRVVAELHLALARLAPDIGHLRDSAHHAQAALCFYEQLGETPVQLEAILLLAGAANQTGEPQRSLSLVRLARRRQATLAENEPYWQLAISNQEAHSLWYLGSFAEATAVAAAALPVADTIPHTKQRIYLRLLLGNLHRAQGHYTAAHHYYAEAERLLAPLDFTLYGVWIQVQAAWLVALQGELRRARQALHQAFDHCDGGQAMSFNVFLAAVYSLERQFAPAAQLLSQAQHFFANSGDPLSVCAIDCHLAYLAIAQQQWEKAQIHTRASLAWLAEHNLCYFPHWWHEQIVGAVVAFAIQHAICPATAERILLGPLHTATDSSIGPRLSGGQSARSALAPPRHSWLEPSVPFNLAFVEDSPARAVLAELLSQGGLNAARFEELKTLLVTGKQRGQPNPTLLAVFGLYLQGWSRRDIAARLLIAEATVRNYVTLIYEVFPVSTELPLRPQQRLVALRACARQAGFIGDGKL